MKPAITLPGISADLVERANQAMQRVGNSTILAVALPPNAYVSLVTMAQTGLIYSSLDGPALIQMRQLISGLSMNAASADPVLAEFLEKSFAALLDAKAQAEDHVAKMKQTSDMERELDRPGWIRRVLQRVFKCTITRA